MDNLFSVTDRLLERALDGVSARQRVTAHNIANVNTPGYKRQRLSFEQSLREAVHDPASAAVAGVVTHPRHIPIGERVERRSSGLFAVERDMTTTMRDDGNNVDIEAEMAQIVKDQVFYQALADQVSRRYAMLRDAIIEGRR